MILPDYSCDTNFDTFQTDLPQAIKVAARFPGNHPEKLDRLEFMEHLIMQGADPMKVMDLQGEDTTPMQRAIEYGDTMTIQRVRNAMARFALAPPKVVCCDPDAHRDENQQKKLPIAILFPGQGSQYVKMLAEVQHLAPCKALIDEANEILGYDLLDLCLNGPEEKLSETKYCQPAMFVANCCALEKLRIEKPDVVARCQATAGLSLGEYNALWLAGMIYFALALRIVRTRADAMNEESKKGEQAMASVAGLSLEILQTLCEQAALQAGKTETDQDSICQIANHLFPKGYTVTGTRKAVDILMSLAESEGALQARLLKTGGAFHSPLMEPASLKLNRALKANLTSMRHPTKDVYMNVSGWYQRAFTDPREINMDLTAQISSPVLWQQSVQQMLKDGITEFYECGPMKQLKAMMKRISQEAWEKTYSCDV